MDADQAISSADNFTCLTVGARNPDIQVFTKHPVDGQASATICLDEVIPSVVCLDVLDEGVASLRDADAVHEARAPVSGNAPDAIANSQAPAIANHQQGGVEVVADDVVVDGHPPTAFRYVSVKTTAVPDRSRGAVIDHARIRAAERAALTGNIVAKVKRVVRHSVKERYRTVVVGFYLLAAGNYKCRHLGPQGKKFPRQSDVGLCCSTKRY